MLHNFQVACWVIVGWCVLGAIISPVLGKFIAVGSAQDPVLIVADVA